ncbi:f-box only protein [Anaeramoeba flamelloides]|uniref:F-box only protein n=1 Tax=Anaeramoeba flamelloides TaxID=1746091 RepID=A0ABQ8XEB4_9EUKA|nr:f-box only protein [Anaeramoeba flamelloides]
MTEILTKIKKLSRFIARSLKSLKYNKNQCKRLTQRIQFINKFLSTRKLHSNIELANKYRPILRELHNSIKESQTFLNKHTFQGLWLWTMLHQGTGKHIFLNLTERISTCALTLDCDLSEWDIDKENKEDEQNDREELEKLLNNLLKEEELENVLDRQSSIMNKQKISLSFDQAVLKIKDRLNSLKMQKQVEEIQFVKQQNQPQIKKSDLDFSFRVIEFKDIKLGQRLAFGAYGEVFIAEWSGVQVAVKKLISNSKELFEEYFNELTTLSKLQHPNVVNLLGGTITPPYCIVMTFYRFGNLNDILMNYKIDISLIQWLKIGKQIANGMRFLHDSKIIHRDLKPKNILLTEEEGRMIAKIIDFGTSKKKDTGQSLRTVCGTYRYMAPEVARAESYSYQCDVYSFSLILLEMISKERPFLDLTENQIFAFHFKNTNNNPKRPKISEQIDPEIKTLIETCWSEEPDRRLTFEEVYNQLDEIIERLEIQEEQQNGKTKKEELNLLTKILFVDDPKIDEKSKQKQKQEQEQEREREQEREQKQEMEEKENRSKSQKGYEQKYGNEIKGNFSNNSFGSFSYGHRRIGTVITVGTEGENVTTLTEALYLAQTEDIIELSSGIYYTDGLDITIPRLRIQGKKSISAESIIISSSSARPIFRFQADNCGLFNLTLENNTNKVRSNFGIVEIIKGNTRIEGCYIQSTSPNPPFACILSKGPKSIPIIRRNELTGCSHGIAIRNQGKLFVEENLIYKNHLSGIFFEDAKHAMIKQNEILQNQQHGILITTSPDVHIIENQISENKICGLKSIASKVILKNNQITKNRSSGIEIMNETNGDLIKNKILSNRGFGILIGSRSSPNIQLNIIEKNYGGIHVAEGGRGKIIDNKIVTIKERTIKFDTNEDQNNVTQSNNKIILIEKISFMDKDKDNGNEIGEEGGGETETGNGIKNNKEQNKSSDKKYKKKNREIPINDIIKNIPTTPKESSKPSILDMDLKTPLTKKGEHVTKNFPPINENGIIVLTDGNRKIIVDAKGHETRFTTIRSALECAINRDIIEIQPGTYTESITVRKPNLEFVGITKDEKHVIIQNSQKSTFTFRTTSGKVSNIFFRQKGLKFYAVDIVSGKLEMEKCNIAGNGNAALSIRKGADPVITNCRIHNGRVGVVFHQKAKGTLKSCEVIECSYQGIAITNHSQSNILTTKVSKNGEGGVVVMNGSTCLLHKCDISFNKLSGVTIRSSADPQIQNCKIHHNQQAGCFIFENGKGEISSNEIFLNGKTGIACKDNSNPRVLNNQIFRNEESGIFVYNQSTGVYKKNNIFRNTLSGFQAKINSSPVVEKNKIHHNTGSGIFAYQNTNGKITNNEIYLNQLRGIDVESGSSPVVNNNKVTENKGGGIFVYKNGAGSFTKNKVNENERIQFLIKKGCFPQMDENIIPNGGIINENVVESD